MMRMIAMFIAIGLANCSIADTTSIVSEKPKYWYRFDSDITTGVGVTNLAFSSTANSNIHTQSPWGYALRLDGCDGPWGSTFDVPHGDWTYHMRLKLPSNLTNGVVWCLGDCGASNSLLLLSQGEVGVSLVTVKSKSIIKRADFDVAGLTARYHDIAVIYVESLQEVVLFVDGEEQGVMPCESLSGVQMWQWFTPIGRYVSSLKAGWDVLIEEMRFYDKALSTDELTDLHNHASVSLTEDEDWSSSVPTNYAGKMVILNGHTVTMNNPDVALSCVGAVTDVDTNNSGRVITVATNAVSLSGDKIVGGVHYVKRGSGLLELHGNNSASCDIDEGTVKLVSCNGFVANATVTVGSNGVVDVNGCVDTKAKLVFKDGGTLANTGNGTSYKRMQFGLGCEVDPSAVCYISLSNTIYFISSGYAKYNFNLHGGTLIKNGSGTTCIANADITGGGVIRIEEGRFDIGWRGLSVADDVALEVKKSAVHLWISDTCSVPTIIGDGYVAANGSALTVTKYLSGLIQLGSNEGEGKYIFTESKKLTLSGGATLDLTANTSAYVQHKNFAFGEGTITVDVSSRKLVHGEKIITWESMPEGVTFKWDDLTAESGVLPIVASNGLYFGEECLPSPNVIPSGCSFANASQEVTLSCDTEDATIYYTIDGSEPSAANGRRYKGPFDIWQTTTVKAIAAKDDWKDSSVASATFTKENQLSEALNCLNILPDNDEDAPWTIDTNVSHDGVSSVKSGAIGHSGETGIQLSVKKAGRLSFWWRAQCEEPDPEDGPEGYYDYAALMIDGEDVASLAGEDTGWQQFVTNITSGGKHIIRWEYRKDKATTTPPDCVWVDQVQWLSASATDETDHTLTTETPVPYTWLDKYGLGRESDFEAAAKAKSGKCDGAGRELTVEEEYIAGTDPTNKTSQLTSKIEMIDGIPSITWDPDLEDERTYKVWGSENLSDWQYPTNALHRFFKVTVEMP